jgi:REP element-mobilizing transposase RayT
MEKMRASCPRPQGSQDHHFSAEYRRKIETLLDAGRGSCILRDSRVAAIVVENWHHHAGSRYDLGAWVVMPNHVHVLIRVHAGQPLDCIVHSWKSYTAKQIAKEKAVATPIWQPDYWDRFIRDERHWLSAKSYIEQNPVAAGLAARSEDWPWSSAYQVREEAGGPPAVPGAASGSTNT